MVTPLDQIVQTENENASDAAVIALYQAAISGQTTGVYGSLSERDATIATEYPAHSAILGEGEELQTPEQLAATVLAANPDLAAPTRETSAGMTAGF